MRRFGAYKKPVGCLLGRRSSGRDRNVRAPARGISVPPTLRFSPLIPFAVVQILVLVIRELSAKEMVLPKGRSAAS